MQKDDPWPTSALDPSHDRPPPRSTISGAWICIASSRVGAMTSPMGPSPGATPQHMRMAQGSAKAMRPLAELASPLWDAMALDHDVR